MEAKRSQLRFKITVSLALAGLTAAGGVLLYRAQTVQAQEQEQEFQQQPGDEPNQQFEAPEQPFQDGPPPPPQPELPLLPLNGDNDDDDAPELMPPEEEPNGAATAPTTTTAPATAPAIPAEQIEQRIRRDPPRGTRVGARRGPGGERDAGERESGERQPGARDTAAAAPATQPAVATAGINGINGGSAPPATQPGAVFVPPNGNPGGIILNFQNASIDAVLEELSAVAGFIVVKEVPRIEGSVTLVSKQPVTPGEAVTLLNTVLLKSSLTAVRQGRVLKVMEISKAMKSAIPVRTGNDPEAIEPTDELITQVIPIRNADAEQLKDDLEPLVDEERIDFSSNASSNSIMITDTAANVRRIVQVVSALDQQMASSMDVKVFQLKFAAAASTAKLITDLFGPQASSGQGQQQQQGFPFPFGFRSSSSGSDRGGDRGRDGDRNRGGSSNSSSRESRQAGRVTASADDRTNTVVVTGPPETLLTIATIVEQIDSDPAEEQSVFVYSLRNAQSIQLESVINSLFNGTGTTNRPSSQSQLGRTGSRTLGGSTSGGSSGRSSGFGGSSSSSGRSSSGGFGSSGFGSSGFGSSGFGSSSRSGFGGFSGFGSSGGVSSGSSRAASELAGQVTVVADADTNSLLVMTSPKNFDRVRQVIEELDRAVPQVLIKVLIAEVTHDNQIDVGTEFSVLNLRADGTGQSGATIGTDFGVAAAGGGMVVRLLETDVTATLRLLERNGKLDVLSRPYILASDNQLASITVGQNVPFPTNSRITDDGQTLTSIDYRDVGILLDVIPHINPDGLVIMDVQPTISALTDSTVAISEQFDAPIVATRSALSRVSIENGKTIVIGGLMEDRKTETVRKVPWVGDLPVVGAAFRRTERTKTKTELLIFLTPHVASSPDKLPAMSEDETRGTKLLHKAVEPGAYELHREGMQRGATQVDPRGGARTGGNAVRDVPPGPAERPRRRPTTMPAE